MHPSLLPMLRSIGIEGDYQPKLTAADVPAALAARPYQGLMVRSKMRITASLLAHGPQLRYVARAGDTLASVTGSVYAGLTTADWIRDSNGMPEGAALDAGTTLFVPLHCACFGGADDGVPAVYLTYVVAGGDTVPAIARRFRTTGNDLMSVNDLATADVAAGDIIVVPLPGE